LAIGSEHNVIRCRLDFLTNRQLRKLRTLAELRLAAVSSLQHCAITLVRWLLPMHVPCQPAPTGRCCREAACADPATVCCKRVDTLCLPANRLMCPPSPRQVPYLDAQRGLRIIGFVKVDKE
jgi:hypothetical protein